MVKGAKKKSQNKNVVGNGSANADDSIEEMEKNAAASAGLGEGPETGNGTAGEEVSRQLRRPPRQPPPRTWTSLTRWQRCWRRRLFPQQ